MDDQSETNEQVRAASDRRLDVLITVVIVSGAFFCVQGITQASDHRTPEWWKVAVGFGLFYLGERAMFSLRFGREHQSFNWLETAMVVGLWLVPVPWLRFVAAAGPALIHLQRRRPLVKVAFNAFSCVTGVQLARHTVRAILGTHVIDPSQPKAWVALSAASFVFFLWNGLTVSLAVAFSQGMRLRDVNDRSLILNLLVWMGNTALGLLIVTLADASPLLLALLPVIFLLLSLAYRSYLQAIHERDTWQVLLGASRELLQVDEEDLVEVVLDRCTELFDADVVEVVVTTDSKGLAARAASRRFGAPVEWRAGTPHELAPASWDEALAEEIFEAPHVAELSPAMSGTERVVAAPIIVQGQVVGVLHLGFRNPKAFTDRHRHILGTFANNISSALHNARLFDESSHRALHDPLTGLPNRILLLDRLQHALEGSKRRGTSVAVLFLDLDRFKVVNDSLGHELGDRLLVAAARRISSVLRPDDTATRFGGDEFVVVCDDVASDEQALEIANRLAAALAAPFDLAGHQVYATVSVGVARSSSSTDDASSLIRDADAAMYRAKDGGRARAEVFDTRMRTEALERLETELDLRQALDRRELCLQYQPAIDLQTGKMAGVEALVRWNHPERGLVPPNLFIPLAEETGLISRVTEWVAAQACSDLAQWRRDGMVDDRFTVAINLSAVELVDTNVVDTIVSAIGRHGLSPAQLAVEITETALLRDLDTALGVLNRLRRFGVSVALDDFGTGYSSLSYLRRLPVDVLKVDRSFIGRLAEDARDHSVVAAMVNLAHALGLRVIAEGVEVPGQADALRGLRCDMAQGWYFARPQAADELFRPRPKLQVIA
ncbi:MAG TPA: EAL domain-containing protein [Acidimicrobiales bacterium]|nr:EAL domain-containing protein [Acidimicrobiales bacterium]